MEDLPSQSEINTKSGTNTQRVFDLVRNLKYTKLIVTLWQYQCPAIYGVSLAPKIPTWSVKPWDNYIFGFLNIIFGGFWDLYKDYGIWGLQCLETFGSWTQFGILGALFCQVKSRFEANMPLADLSFCPTFSVMRYLFNLQLGAFLW